LPTGKAPLKPAGNQLARHAELSEGGPEQEDRHHQYGCADGDRHQGSEQAEQNGPIGQGVTGCRAAVSANVLTIPPLG
jgi:hypothetical protein